MGSIQVLEVCDSSESALACILSRHHSFAFTLSLHRAGPLFSTGDAFMEGLGSKQISETCGGLLHQGACTERSAR